MPETKIVDASHRLSRKHGNGVLRREIRVNRRGKIVRYSLRYINHDIFQGDNERVVGYDNAHGFHHRHYKGKVEAIEFTGFEDVEARFEADWLVFRKRGK